MANPGWYPEPDGSGWEQFFDGQVWTGQRRPAAAPPAPVPPPAQPTGPTTPVPPASPVPPGPAPDEPAPPGPAPDEPAESDLTIPRPTQVGPAAGQPASGYPAPTTPLPEPPAYGTPAYGTPGYGTPGYGAAPAYGTPGYGATPTGYAPQSQAQQPYPEQPYPEQPYAAQGYPPQPPWAQPGWAPAPEPRRRKRVPLIIGLVLVVAAGLAAGGYFLFSGDESPKFTYAGKQIANPDEALAQAGSTLRSLVASRHGAQNKDTRCYFRVPDQPSQGAKETDIDRSVWCGPVLFVDGAPGKPYLVFDLRTADAGGGKVKLLPAKLPRSDDPTSIPTDASLERPDGAKPPSGAGGLTSPKPPPAAKNALVAADLGNERVPSAPRTAVMGGLDGGVKVAELGLVDRYGIGDDARSAPDGERLIAFQLTHAEGDNGDVNDLSDSARVVVNGGKGRKLPSADRGEHIVIAVPKAARSVDLVLNTAGYRQTISLLNGKPGSGNITVLARSHRNVTLHKSGRVKFSFSKTVVFDDGSTGKTETGRYSTSHATLYFTIPDKHVKARRPGNALLYVDLGYRVRHSPGEDFGFPPQLVTFTPSGKKPIRARNVATDKDHIYDIFEVPGSLRSGVLKVSGSYPSKFANTGDTYTTTISTPIRIRVSFPAN